MIFRTFLMALVCASFPVGARAGSPLIKELGPDLVVRRLAPGVWIHTCTRDEGRRRSGANGMLITTGEMSILVDTGWSGSQARRLLDWADDSLGQPVEHVIVTHSHEDRAGGLAAIVERPIVVHGHVMTANRLKKSGYPGVVWTFEFEEQRLLGGERVHLFYPGPGHAPDNSVVWFPRREVLFGGCLIKPESARGLGYIGDANMEAWPLAVRRVIERYRTAEVLIPGHGSPGGLGLLSHTMELLEGYTFSHKAPQ